MTSAREGGAFNRPGYAEAFKIGLKPIDDPDAWLAPDRRLADCLAEKAVLIGSRREDVFRARPDTTDAQAEVLAMLAEHLPSAFPGIYLRSDASIAIGGIDAAVPVEPETDAAPLLTGSRLVADDLVLMRKHDDGWRLVAASLCFPSYWSLAEKFDKPLATIHAPVPGFAAGSRNAVLIERIFDSLQTDVVVGRSNWSVHDNGGLFRPQPHPAHLFAHDDDMATLAKMHIRCEDQTLRKLPQSGDILFTIRVATDPMAGIFDHPGLAGSLAARLRALDGAGRNYKGLQSGRDLLAGWLERGGV